MTTYIAHECHLTLPTAPVTSDAAYLFPGCRSWEVIWSQARWTPSISCIENRLPRFNIAMQQYIAFIYTYQFIYIGVNPRHLVGFYIKKGVIILIKVDLKITFFQYKQSGQPKRVHCIQVTNMYFTPMWCMYINFEIWGKKSCPVKKIK